MIRTLLILLAFTTTLQAAPVPPSPKPDPMRNPDLTLGYWSYLSTPKLNAKVCGQKIEYLVVYNVNGDSPAARNGFKNEDIVRKVNGESVNQYYHIQTIISCYRPGAFVKVEVERNGKPVELKVQLGVEEDYQGPEY